MSGSAATAAPSVSRAPAVSAWGPLRHTTFRIIWIAQFAANIGTWAQQVGAQWLIGDLGGGALEIALVQTATSLPVFLLVLPAGALGDIFDRRRVLLVSNALQMTAAGALALLTAVDAVTPTVVLALTATMGTGAAFAMPTAAAIQPELVPREAIGQAALLNGANLNVARAIGPAVGGALISIVGPEATFALNAVSFVGVLFALFWWERSPEHRPLGAEHIRGAVRAGVRYVRSSPAYATVLARTVVFIVFGSSLWALLPVVARGPLGLGAGGYGLLLASVGLGAVIAAFAIPGARDRMKANIVVSVGSVATGAALLAVALSESLVVVFAALALFGFGWIAVMSTLSGCSQVLLPNWIRARGLAFFTLTFMGGQAIGSVVWGLVADGLSLHAAFAISAAGLVVGPLAGVRHLRLHPVGDVRPSRHWPRPNVALEPEPNAGPVLVTVEWRVAPDNTAPFLDAMRAAARARRRTGASMWGLFEDMDQPNLFVESFTVATWQEHLRQHIERPTVADERLDLEVRGYLTEGEEPRVRHLIWAYRPTV